jgi:ABC-type dipeptide/oligopeptide/nickel transport system permease subunit
MGRDTMSRIIYGSRISLMVGIIVVTVAGVIGMFMGLAAGYFGGWTNALIMRFNDALMSLPPIVLMLALCAALGGGLMSILISVGIVLAPTYCRLMCGQILTLKNSDFVTAARVIGAHDLRIMVRHLLPNAFPPLLVLITINLGTAIMFEATLSFLGIGIRPPTATWGNMVMDGYRFLLKNPILSFAPGLSITLLVLGFNLVGDGLRDALDPRLRGTI